MNQKLQDAGCIYLGVMGRALGRSGWPERVLIELPICPFQSPPKGATIPYHPSLSLGTVLLSANQVRGLAGGMEALLEKGD